MIDLSRSWPLGLGERRWWVVLLVVLLGLGLAFTVDRQLSLWAQGWPLPIRDALKQISPYGESGWILYPAAFLFVITVAVALFVRWKLMKMLLWQFAGLYGFIFLGVGLPGLVSTLAKRVIGRGRPQHFDQTGLFGMHWNWTDWTYQSFPSGHATTAFALAAVIGFVTVRWFYPTLALATVIAVSRVALGVHYPSDVLAGAMLGLIGAYAVRWGFARRGWVFRFRDGRIVMRPMSSLKRYMLLKRRDIAPGPKRVRS